MNDRFNKLFKEALHRKMDKLERKLVKYANAYFEDEMTIMYLRKKQIKKAGD